MRALGFLVVLGLCTSGLAAPTSPPTTAVKALVLDIKSTDLSASEVDTLTSLITTHLARYPQLEVMSGADIKRLVDLAAQKQTVGCNDDSCLSEIAGALGAQLVFYGQAGKLGSTIVVTLSVFDAGKGVLVGRQSIEARSTGQLPKLVGPAIDNMVGQIFEGLRAPLAGAAGSNNSLRASPEANLDARAREVYDQQEMRICVDEKDALRWWFCDRNKRHTENAFIRDYKKLTAQADLDVSMKNRNKESALVPGLLIGGGSGLMLAAAPIAYFTFVDTPPPSDLLDTPVAGASLGAWGVGGGLAIGAGLAIYGGILMGDALEFTDGEVTDHSLTELDARDAAVRFNDALAEKVGREHGAAL